MSGERSTVEVLRAARERISDPERWTRRTFARDKDGNTVSPHGAKATRWCARGAIYRESGLSEAGYDVEDALRQALTPEVEFCGEEIAAFNDSNDHADVLALYDRAIELAEAQGA